MYGIVHFPAICQLKAGIVVSGDEKIRELCSQLVTAQSDEAISRFALLLRDALREHYEEASKRLAVKFRFSPGRDIAADKPFHGG